jgi:hypothetical protein
MAFALFLRWKGVTREQYNSLRETLRFDISPPEGVLLHVAAFDDTGLTVTDVWESPEAFQSFAGAKLQPAAAAAGMSGEPEVVLLPRHFGYVRLNGNPQLLKAEIT